MVLSTRYLCSLAAYQPTAHCNWLFDKIIDHFAQPQLPNISCTPRIYRARVAEDQVMAVSASCLASALIVEISPSHLMQGFGLRSGACYSPRENAAILGDRQTVRMGTRYSPHPPPCKWAQKVDRSPCHPAYSRELRISAQGIPCLVLCLRRRAYCGWERKITREIC